MLGSISFAVIASWIFRLPDPRTFGSMNPGATNVLRSGNKAAAIFTLLGDAGKGFVAVILAQYFAPIWGLDSKVIAAAVALLVFLGHIWPIFLHFKGGRGVATAVGVVFGLNFWSGVLAIITWIIVALIWRFFIIIGISGSNSHTDLCMDIFRFRSQCLCNFNYIDTDYMAT